MCEGANVFRVVCTEHVYENTRRRGWHMKECVCVRLHVSKSTNKGIAGTFASFIAEGLKKKKFKKS